MDSNVDVATMFTFSAPGSSAIDGPLGISTQDRESSPMSSHPAPTVEPIDDLPSLPEVLISNSPHGAPTAEPIDDLPTLPEGPIPNSPHRAPTAEPIDDLLPLPEGLISNDPNIAPTSERRGGEHQIQANLDTTNTEAVRISETSGMQRTPKLWNEMTWREQRDEMRRNGGPTRPARRPPVRPWKVEVSMQC